MCAQSLNEIRVSLGPTERRRRELAQAADTVARATAFHSITSMDEIRAMLREQPAPEPSIDIIPELRPPPEHTKKVWHWIGAAEDEEVAPVPMSWDGCWEYAGRRRRPSEMEGYCYVGPAEPPSRRKP
jgi:hypothetical protein